MSYEECDIPSVTIGSEKTSHYTAYVCKIIIFSLCFFNVDNNPSLNRIFWESEKFEGQTDMVEPWYGTAYSIEKITGSMIQQWVEAAPNEHLHLPEPNVFIPTDLSLKDVQEKAKFPLLLRKSSYSRLWFKPDTMFFTPKASIRIDFNCPYASHSPEAEVLTDIFTRLLMDYLNEYAYYAQVAGLYYGINHMDNGFQEMVTKEYQNCKFQQPYQQAIYYCSLILEDHSWPWMEALEVLPHLEADDLAKFSPVMLSKAFLECYVAGNIKPNEAESMIQHIEDVLYKGPQPICKPLLPSQHLANRIIKLERGINHFYPAEGLNPCNENSALVHYIQVHQDDLMLNVKLQLFVLIAKQPAFHQLRSVEQLGYITMLVHRYSRSAIYRPIHSKARQDPRQIDLRVEAFLKAFESKLYEMTNGEFKSNVNTLIDMKLEKYKNLGEESRFYWQEIVRGTLKFDRKESEVAALQQLTQQELINFFDEYIKIGAPKRKTLSIQVYGGLHSTEYKAVKSELTKPESMRIDDIISFRRSQPLYGSLKGGLSHMKL
ncbi:hypothetical protein HHK36_019786 [Tetracentron sinense]|uniref:Uncharacterized protein n=1 Tax=Tetracentron sinense TaxID=13715 RepID=A0A834YX06_TETSI|nr:hypothetical protein HHK36_019786 [Tetracentron sinense]